MDIVQVIDGQVIFTIKPLTDMMLQIIIQASIAMMTVFMVLWAFKAIKKICMSGITSNSSSYDYDDTADRLAEEKRLAEGWDGKILGPCEPGEYTDADFDAQWNELHKEK